MSKKTTKSSKKRKGRPIKRKGPTIGEAFLQVMDSLDGAMPEEEFFERVLQIRPSSAKNPSASLRHHLRYEREGRLLVPLADGLLLPLYLLFQGLRYRIPLTRFDIEKKLLCLDTGFEVYLSPQLELRDIELLDTEGQPIALEPVQFSCETHVEDDIFSREVPAFQMEEWFAQEGFVDGDSIIVTILDWNRGRFQLEREPASARDEEAIAAQNQRLMDLLFEQLEQSSGEQLSMQRGVPQAYAQLPPSDTVGDFWLLALYKDQRMAWNHHLIVYYDELEGLLIEMLLQRFILDGQLSPVQTESKEPPSEEEMERVYRFKVTHTRRKGLWCRFEVQGKNTLQDLDELLRSSFDLDPFDHLSEFTKRIPRSQGKRRSYREINFGSIYPFFDDDDDELDDDLDDELDDELDDDLDDDFDDDLDDDFPSGEYPEEEVSNRLPFATLAFEPGEQLQYTYDFGSPVVLRGDLEEITEAEEGVDYPCILEKKGGRKGRD